MLLSKTLRFKILKGGSFYKIRGVFLKKAMTMIVEEAKNKGVSTLTAEIMDEIRDKRNQEKKLR